MKQQTVKDFSILLLPSTDGNEWDKAVLYPWQWSDKKARDNAERAMSEAKRKYPDDWDWDDLCSALQAAGFIVLDYTHGPAWD